MTKLFHYEESPFQKWFTPFPMLYHYVVNILFTPTRKNIRFCMTTDKIGMWKNSNLWQYIQVVMVTMWTYLIFDDLMRRTNDWWHQLCTSLCWRMKLFLPVAAQANVEHSSVLYLFKWLKVECYECLTWAKTQTTLVTNKRIYLILMLKNKKMKKAHFKNDLSPFQCYIIM